MKAGPELAKGHPKGSALTPARTAPHSKSREQGRDHGATIRMPGARALMKIKPPELTAIDEIVPPDGVTVPTTSTTASPTSARILAGDSKRS